MSPEENNAVIVLQLAKSIKINLGYFTSLFTFNEGAAEKKTHQVHTGAVGSEVSRRIMKKNDLKNLCPNNFWDTNIYLLSMCKAK